MKRFVTLSLVALATSTLGACKAQPRYECTIRDARTGEVIRRVKVVYKSECDALALTTRQ